MNWSPLQHEALEAMGFAVYRMPGADVASRADTAPPVRSADASSAAASAPRSAMPRPAAPLPAAPSRPGADAGAVGDRLRVALLRAAGGVDPAALSALIGESDAIGRLRGDPAAKRALWPRLRALRRSGA